MPMLSHPHCEKVFPVVQTEPPVLPLLCLWFCHWALLKRARCVLFASSLQVFTNINKIPPAPSLLQVEQSKLSLSSYEACPSLFAILLAHRWTLSSSSASFLYWGAENLTQYSRRDRNPVQQDWTHCSPLGYILPQEGVGYAKHTTK